MIRVQLRRTKGWRMPENTVNCARPGKFGNPFRITGNRNAAQAVGAFRIWLTVEGCDAGLLLTKRMILNHLPTLRGKNLACWCKLGTPCHADVLMELANVGAGS